MEPWLQAVCLVARPGRVARPDRAGARVLIGSRATRAPPVRAARAGNKKPAHILLWTKAPMRSMAARASGMIRAQNCQALTERFSGRDPHAASGHPGLELAALAETPEIGGHDGPHRHRLDAEPRQRATGVLGLLRNDVVAQQELDLIPRQLRLDRQELGRQLEKIGQNPDEPE